MRRAYEEHRRNVKIQNKNKNKNRNQSKPVVRTTRREILRHHLTTAARTVPLSVRSAQQTHRQANDRRRRCSRRATARKRAVAPM